jgi:hypothetical protein
MLFGFHRSIDVLDRLPETPVCAWSGSFTELDTSTPPGAATDETRAPMWTATPRRRSSTRTHSPVCTPTRSSIRSRGCPIHPDGGLTRPGALGHGRRLLGLIPIEDALGAVELAGLVIGVVVDLPGRAPVRGSRRGWLPEHRHLLEPERAQQRRQRRGRLVTREVLSADQPLEDARRANERLEPHGHDLQYVRTLAQPSATSAGGLG